MKVRPAESAVCLADVQRLIWEIHDHRTASSTSSLEAESWCRTALDDTDLMPAGRDGGNSEQSSIPDNHMGLSHATLHNNANVGPPMVRTQAHAAWTNHTSQQSGHHLPT